MGVEDEFTEIFEKLGLKNKTPIYLNKYIQHGQIFKLDLGFLKITSLPIDIFDKLYHLQELYLHNNKISTLPLGIFDGLKSLKELYLYGNELSSLPDGIFDKLDNLQKLVLDYNHLSNLPDTIFNKLTNLQVLRLDNNQLSNIPINMIDSLPKLKELILSKNPELSTQGLDVKLKNKSEVETFINQRKRHVQQVIEAKQAEEQRITALLTKILKIIQQITPNIQVQLTRIAELSGGNNQEVENFLKIILDDNPELGQFLEFEQVFIRKEINLTDDLLTSSISNFKSNKFGGGDVLQICANCKETQSTLIRECTNCKSPLSFCNLCKRGFSLNDYQLHCPKCEHPFHRNHLSAYIQSKGECPICQEGLTLSQFE